MIEIFLACLCLSFIINTIVTWVYITNVACASNGFGLYCTNEVVRGPAPPAPVAVPKTSTYTVEPYPM